MTPQEFKAWFDGYTENITKQPTQKQWKRIQERVGEIDGNPVSEIHYYERYWAPYYQTWPYYTGTPWYIPPVTCGSTISISNTDSFNGTTTTNKASPITYTNNVNTTGYANVSGYDSLTAMKALGQAEARA